MHQSSGGPRRPGAPPGPRRVHEQGAGVVHAGGNATRAPYPADRSTLQRVALAPRGEQRRRRRATRLERAQQRGQHLLHARARRRAPRHRSSGGNSTAQHVQPDPQHRPPLLPAGPRPGSPPTLRPPSQTSFGHLISVAADASRPPRRPRRSGSSGSSSRSDQRHQHRAARRRHPLAALRGPRPAVCSSAVTSVPCGAPAAASSFARSFVGVGDPRGARAAGRSSRPQPHLGVGAQPERRAGVAAVDRDRQRPVGVLVDDQLARRPTSAKVPA